MGFDFKKGVEAYDEWVKEKESKRKRISILKPLLQSEIEDTKAIAGWLDCDDCLEDEDMEELLQVLIEKVELVDKKDSIYQFADKYDTLPQKIAFPLLRGSASTEYNLKRGYLDTRLDSRLLEGYLADIFKALKGVTPTQEGDYKYYPINDGTMVVIIPMEDWVNADIRVNQNAKNKTIYLFVNEIGRFTTIGGQRVINPETIVFRGVYKSTDKGFLNFDNPRLEIPV